MRRAVFVLTALFALCVAALTGGGMVILRSGASQPSGPDMSDLDLAFRPHPGALLPLATSLADEEGRSVALGDYFKKSPVILVLDYLRCTSLCGVTLRNLIVDALDRLPFEAGRDYQLVSISIDPRDTPADAAAARTKYAALQGRAGSDSGMHFLTASPVAVQEITDSVGFPYRYDALLDAYIHPAGFIIVAPDGVISRYVEGVAASPQELVDALADAKRGKSQDPLTRLLLFCHVQGAPLGRFSTAVLIALTIADIAAALTLLALFNAIRRQRYG
jgi:protein SCO1/2